MGKAANARRKGAHWELSINKYLRSRGLNMRRARGGEHQPHGDLIGLPGWVLEAKNHKNLADGIRRGMDQVQTIRAGRKAAVIHKRPRKPINEAYVIMRLDQWADWVLDSQAHQVATAWADWIKRVREELDKAPDVSLDSLS